MVNNGNMIVISLCTHGLSWYTYGKSVYDISWYIMEIVVYHGKRGDVDQLRLWLPTVIIYHS